MNPMTNSTTTPQRMQTDAHNPQILEELHIPLCLEAVLDMGPSVSAHAAKARVQRLLEQAQQTDDPIEAMMIEQLCVAHHRTAALHARSAQNGLLNQPLDRETLQVRNELAGVSDLIQQMRDTIKQAG